MTKPKPPLRPAQDIVLDIRELLWPGGDADHEWDSAADHLEHIAALLSQGGWGPEVPFSEGSYMRKSCAPE